MGLLSLLFGGAKDPLGFSATLRTAVNSAGVVRINESIVQHKLWIPENEVYALYTVSPVLYGLLGVGDCWYGYGEQIISISATGIAKAFFCKDGNPKLIEATLCFEVARPMAATDLKG